MTAPSPLRVSVGVLTAGRPDLLGPCLDSMRAARGAVRPKEIIVCENSLEVSAWPEVEVLCRREHAPLWINQEERSLAACWNFLVSGRWDEPARWGEPSCSDRGVDAMVICNDDLEVPHFWLDALEHALRFNPDLGIVSLQQYRGQRLQLVSERGARCAPLRAFTMGVGGYCFAVRVADWCRVGGFDPDYWRFYEDLDFGAKLTQLGRRNVDLREPRVYHRIGATTGALGREVNERNMEISRARFVRKWAPVAGLPVPDDAAEFDAATKEIARRLLARLPDDRPKAMWTQELNEREAAGEAFEADTDGDWFLPPEEP